jgi:NADH-quinone oxidoreductase subunit F
MRERNGGLGKPELRFAAESLNVSEAELYGAATFYPHLSPEEDLSRLLLCDGPVCRAAWRKQGVSSMKALPGGRFSCLGHCDEAPACLADKRECGRLNRDAVKNLAGLITRKGSRKTAKGDRTALARVRARKTPPTGAVSSDTPLLKWIERGAPSKLKSYLRQGGYKNLSRLANKASAERFLARLEKRGLCGRGGAGFPTARKWRAVRAAARRPKYIVCNADEGEFATFKDRYLLTAAPHLVLEGMAAAALVVGAEDGFIYLRYEYADTYDSLKKAIREAEKAGCIGKRVRGTKHPFRVHVRRAGGAYVCGEETALFESLEGRRPLAREKPPYPTEAGLGGAPTVINNVETLAYAAFLLGAAAPSKPARGRSALTRLHSVSGCVARPGVYELPSGASFKRLLEEAGGADSGRRVAAFALGGFAGGILPAKLLDSPMRDDAVHKKGCMLGTGTVYFLDEEECPVNFVQDSLHFLSHESCGKCFPCRLGVPELERLLLRSNGDASERKVLMDSVGRLLAEASLCGLGKSAPIGYQCLERYFSKELDIHFARGTCSKARAGSAQGATL